MKSIFLLPLVIGLLFFGSNEVPGDFTGTITYKYTRTNLEGKILSFPQDVESVYISDSKILVQIISGQIKHFVEYDLLLDLSTNRCYQVNHQEKTITEVAIQKSKDLNFEHHEQPSQRKILNHECTEIIFKRLDVHSGDTVNYTYYFNQNFQKKNLRDFAILQGNSNTLFLDGRFEKLPLRIEMRYPNGEVITIEAINFSRQDHHSSFSYPSYKLINAR